MYQLYTIRNALSTTILRLYFVDFQGLAKACFRRLTLVDF